MSQYIQLCQSSHHHLLELLHIHLLHDKSLVSLVQEAQSVYNHHASGVSARQLYTNCMLIAFYDERVVYGSRHGVRVAGNKTHASDYLFLKALRF